MANAHTETRATNEYGLKHRIDRRTEMFGAEVTIADLAALTFGNWSSDDLDIYTAAKLIQSNWRWELADFEYEYLVGATFYFKDGSELAVSAWAGDEPDDEWA